MSTPKMRRSFFLDLSDCFKQVEDYGKSRTLPVPNKEVLMANLENLKSKWKDELKNCPDTIKAIDRIIQNHLPCLENLPIGYGTNKNEGEYCL